ncbi:MAG: 1-deoxy-D-xylulose-5-phosphate synthase [Chitinivibrionales bacterium]|nr:1-deoxy-D-xylulose-5-phosphate synthase [Chitinivibrionales bacterium]MBD3358572.1 1-deoxy-D-xylulose-5-phosphate synthase [Chitinivibrionales bacterium]
MSSLLEAISSPADLRALPKTKLPAVAEEIRDILIETVSRRGGHLASSLGAVELAIALHYCYKTPEDKLLWDVGHQAYAHKILTGRRERFDSLRAYKGISGFPRISESEYDNLSVGHSSTSISAGLGMALARDLRGESHGVVAVIGDGSLSSGLAFEGLNNFGSSSTNMTVVLNDNEMSISKNVGALSRYLTRLLTDKRYNRIKSDVWELLGNLHNVGERIRTLVHSVDDAVKHFVIPGKLFEDMGLRYFGPIDGHNINDMLEIFQFVRNAAKGPVLVHVITKKGKGYRFAEKDATKYHGIGCFSRSTGDVIAKGNGVPSYSEVVGKTLTEIAAENEDLVAITAAMPDGTGLKHFRDAYPKRFFDVGIAESHAVTFAAGLALRGLRPVVAVYSTFLQRAYDQIIHDVALDKLNVVFCVDRAGLVGEDGPTHHGMFDLSFLRTVPNLTIMAPADEAELRDMLFTAIHAIDGPVCIRYPRGCGRGIQIDSPPATISQLSPRTIRKGTKLAIVSVGHALTTAECVCDLLKDQNINPTLIDARFVKPLDLDFYRVLTTNHDFVFTIEHNTITGGFGCGVLELAASEGVQTPIIPIGYPDRFVTHGKMTELSEITGMTPEKITARIMEFAVTAGRRKAKNGQ